jgi:predicted phosphodiesterase
MRILIISDIHSNLTALQTVLDSAGRYDAVWCLGDLVGYGPDPNECIEKVRSLPNLKCVLGNHDAAVLGKMDQETFNHEAGLAISWTRRVINSESHNFLAGLAETDVSGEVTLAHGSPRNPVWEYLMDYPTALQAFPFFETRLCFVGHTHVPALWEQDPGERTPTLVHDYLRMNVSGRCILNPGSVGQPRDHDRRASFALFDPTQSTWELRRVEYDIASVQARVKKTSLPWRNALRLNEGW